VQRRDIWARGLPNKLVRGGAQGPPPLIGSGTIEGPPNFLCKLRTQGGTLAKLAHSPGRYQTATERERNGFNTRGRSHDIYMTHLIKVAKKLPTLGLDRHHFMREKQVVAR
jgi:hypothetical protein